MFTKIPLTKQQKEIFKQFYCVNKTKVCLNKTQRKEIWDFFKENRVLSNKYKAINKICPAIYCEIEKALENNANIQSGVFSECVYAQTLANIFKLNIFIEVRKNEQFVSDEILALLNSFHLISKYIYSNNDKTKILIQAGGCGGIDSVYILISNNDIFVINIEFKENIAKTSEVDLPKHGENGLLVSSQEFINKYPQFEKMLSEHIGYNFFENLGKNIHCFSKESIKYAVAHNYNYNYYKLADVICTEDKNSYLTLLPGNQVEKWAKLEGEIRGTGRNPKKVWTPNKLSTTITGLHGEINDSKIKIPLSNLLDIQRNQRGSFNKSKYKLSEIFIIREKNVKIDNGYIVFDISKVQQINQTITAKLNFFNLDIDKVKQYYLEDLS